jgi:predicted GNAT family acetyltransferase
MTTGFPMASTVRDNPAQNRFELDLGDSMAIAAYRLSPGVVTIHHTEVPPQHGGQGIGSALVRGTLDIIRARNEKVQPRCPFVSAFIRKNPQYRDLLAA